MEVVAVLDVDVFAVESFAPLGELYGGSSGFLVEGEAEPLKLSEYLLLTGLAVLVVTLRNDSVLGNIVVLCCDADIAELTTELLLVDEEGVENIKTDVLEMVEPETV